MRTQRLTLKTYRGHKANKYVLQTIKAMTDLKQPVLQRMKKRKLSLDARVSRHSCISTGLLQGTVEWRRRRARLRKMWLDNIKDWTRLTVDDLRYSTQDRTRERDGGGWSMFVHPNDRRRQDS